MKHVIAILLVLTFSFAAVSQPRTVAFIGNSYTFYPGTWDHPTLPVLVQKLLASAGIFVDVKWVVHGDYTFRKHFEEKDSDGKPTHEIHDLLASVGSGDYVVAQGFSIEAMELTPCVSQATKYGAVGRPEFLEYGEKLINEIRSTGATPLVVQPWIYNDKHPWLQKDFKCYATSEADPTPWFGGSVAEMERREDEGYKKLLERVNAPMDGRLPVPAELLAIGEAWWKIRMTQDATDPIHMTEMYNDDGKHPKMTGSYLAALYIAARISGLPATTFSYAPPEIAPIQAVYLKHIIPLPRNFQNVTANLKSGQSR
jgi:hypothetical protein